MKWPKNTVGKLCHLVRGSSPRPKGDPRYYGGNIPRLMIEDLTRDGKNVTPMVDSLTEEGATLSRPMCQGELVMTVSGRTGVPAILAVDACIHDGFVGFRNLSSDVCTHYLYYYFSFLTERTNSKSVGAIFKNLTTDQIEDLEVPLPPLDVQRQIANTLDKADALRRKDQELLRKYDELAHSIFYEMFGDPVRNEKGWPVAKLGNMVSIDPESVVPANSGGVRYVGLEHIEKETGKLFVSAIAADDLKSLKFRFSKNSLLYGKLRPYLRKVAMPDFGGICSTDIYPIECKKGVDKTFVAQILRSNHFTAFASASSVGANLPRINKKAILDYETIVPPYEDQVKFKTVFEKITRSKDLQSVKESHQLFDALLTQYFA